MKGDYLFKSVDICGYESAGEAGCDSCLEAELVVMSSTESRDNKEKFQKVSLMVDAAILRGRVCEDGTVVLLVAITASGRAEFDIVQFEDECIIAKHKYDVACEEFDKALQLQGAVDIYRNLVHKEK